MRGEQQQFRGAIEPADLPRWQTRVGQGRGQFDFARHLHALSRGVENHDRANRDAAGAKAFGVGLPADTEWSVDPRAGDNDPGRAGGLLWWWKKHDASLIFGETLMNLAVRVKSWQGAVPGDSIEARIVHRPSFQGCQSRGCCLDLAH